MAESDDAKLVAAAAAGDTGAFTALVDRHRQRVYGLLRRMVGDHHWADDLAQETFVKLWDHLGALQDGAAVGAWLRRVATNLGLNHLRDRKRRPEALCEDPVAVAPPEARPSAAREREELKVAIEQAMAALPPERRAALLLRVKEGLSYEQISRRMNCSLGTVMSRLHRARFQIRQYLSASAQL
jgi:RNA polymerase sigma-70 factor (ECF subfamily)